MGIICGIAAIAIGVIAVKYGIGAIVAGILAIGSVFGLTKKG